MTVPSHDVFLGPSHNKDTNVFFCDHDQNFNCVFFISLDELLNFFKNIPVLPDKSFFFFCYLDQVCASVVTTVSNIMNECSVLLAGVRVPVLPGYESSESDLLCRTARRWSQQVSDPHPSSCSNPNHHGSQHPEGPEQRLGNSTTDAWRRGP